MNKEMLARFLTYAGLIPFVALTFFHVIQFEFLALEYPHMILAYGAIIASFIAGMHWGAYLFKSCPINLFIHSNVVALLAWISLLCLPVMGFLLLMFCFLYLLCLDWTLYKAKILEAWFWRLRLYVTSIVALTLGINVLILF